LIYQILISGGIHFLFNIKIEKVITQKRRSIYASLDVMDQNLWNPMDFSSRISSNIRGVVQSVIHSANRIAPTPNHGGGIDREEGSGKGSPSRRRSMAPAASAFNGAAVDRGESQKASSSRRRSMAPGVSGFNVNDIVEITP
jgi:hypothetical protein